jgi:peptide/nickel transport system permease protein
MTSDSIVAGPGSGQPDRQTRRATAWRRRLTTWGNVVHSANPLVVAAAVVATLLVAIAAFAPLLAPFDPNQQALLARLRPPSGFDRALASHLLGTDQLGRDVLARCIYGLRLTLALAFFGTLVGLLIGVTLGLTAGFLGGAADSVLMAIVDVSLSLPFTLVALFVIGVAGANTFVLVGVLGLAYWPHFARLVRAQVLAARELPYMEAARALGASGGRLAFTHMLPNIVSPILVMATLTFSNLILLESSLSFLGLGVQPPTATLGSMVGQGRDYMASAPWIVAVPTTFILLVALVAMLLGDFARDQLDVRLRDR